jgi:hypothetical protein
MYCIINRHIVFITSNNCEQLLQIINKKFNTGLTSYQILTGSKKYDNAERGKKNKLIYSELNNIYMNNKESFEKQWLKFDLSGDEIIENLYDILSDYCTCFGHSILQGFMDVNDEITYSYTGDTLRLPLGEIFSLRHYNKPYIWWWRLFRRMKTRKIDIIIDSKKITRIVGELSDFKIYTQTHIILLKENQIVIS